MKTIVIKFGGSLLDKPRVRNKFFKELIALSQGYGVVLVHGGGAEITAHLKLCGVATTFVNGLRYTDEKTMAIVEMVLSGKVNKQITACLAQLGAAAIGISGRDGNLIVARVISALGRVGEPVKINKKFISVLLHNKLLPVISPIGSDVAGKALNINADTAACSLAIALKAHKLIFMTDVPGILDINGKTIKTITVDEIDSLIAQKVVTGGMIPKLAAAKDAIQKGVQEVDILLGGKSIKQVQGTTISEK